MNIQATKIELAKLILNIESQTLLTKIAALLKGETNDFWDELNKQEKEEIKLGIKQLNSGARINFDAFLKKVS